MKYLSLILCFSFCSLFSQVYEPEENFYFATSESCFYQLLEAVDFKNTEKIKELQSSNCIFKYDKNIFRFKMISIELENPNKPISLSVPNKFKIIGKLPKQLKSAIIWTRPKFARKL
ncbi:hypothetical protein N8817_00045 [Flavobacteriaceae bacterium]|jgi:hypothetical protein|nr:hypothetical protein [Flavobacteriaceae bacterium]